MKTTYKQRHTKQRETKSKALYIHTYIHAKKTYNLSISGTDRAGLESRVLIMVYT